MQALMTRAEIVDVVQTWALARDTGDWERLATTFHPGAKMTATWFHGPFEAFVEMAKASWAKGSRSQHVLGGTLVDQRGERAIVQTRMTIMARGQIDGVAVDVACHGRFYDRFERREGAWKIAERRLVYEKDRVDPVRSGIPLDLDPAILERFPEGYRHLAYLQTKNGQKIFTDLPGARGPALDKLLAEGKAWLEGGA
jgi:hypothetical protein